MDMSTAVIVLLAGFLIVFLVLLLLIGLIKGYSFGINSIEKKIEAKKQKKIKDSTFVVKSVVTPPAAVSETKAGNQINGEVVAVISAAVASMYAGSGKKPVIKTVTRSGSGRNLWNTAGIMDNIRPF